MMNTSINVNNTEAEFKYTCTVCGGTFSCVHFCTGKKELGYDKLYKQQEKNGLKLRIDDVRFPPDDTWDYEFKDDLTNLGLYFAVHSYFKYLLEHFRDVTEISFDHDLGDESDITGYELLRITLELYKACKVPLPKISIHSANPVGVERMKSLLNYY